MHSPVFVPVQGMPASVGGGDWACPAAAWRAATLSGSNPNFTLAQLDSSWPAPAKPARARANLLCRTLIRQRADSSSYPPDDSAKPMHSPVFSPVQTMPCSVGSGDWAAAASSAAALAVRPSGLATEAPDDVAVA